MWSHPIYPCQLVAPLIRVNLAATQRPSKQLELHVREEPTAYFSDREPCCDSTQRLSKQRETLQKERVLDTRHALLHQLSNYCPNLMFGGKSDYTEHRRGSRRITMACARSGYRSSARRYDRSCGTLPVPALLDALRIGPGRRQVGSFLGDGDENDDTCNHVSSSSLFLRRRLGSASLP